MQAITQSRFGGPDVLDVTEVDQPTPLATEVLVAVRAAGLNPVDAAVRSGAFPILGPPPFVLGWDLSGVVTDVVPGCRVCGQVAEMARQRNRRRHPPVEGTSACRTPRRRPRTGSPLARRP